MTINNSSDRPTQAIGSFPGEKSVFAANTTNPEAAIDASGSASEGDASTAVDSEPVEFKADKKFWLALVPVLILAAMVSLDGTAVTVALPVSRNVSF